MGWPEWDRPYISRVSHRRPISRKGELVAFVSALDPGRFCVAHSFGESFRRSGFGSVRFANLPFPAIACPTVLSVIRRRHLLLEGNRAAVRRGCRRESRGVHCASTAGRSREIMEVLPCPVNVDFSNTRGKWRHPAFLLIPPSFNSRSSIVELRSSSLPRRAESSVVLS